MPRSGGLVGGAVPPRDSRENGFGVALHTLRYTAFYGLAESPVLARQEGARPENTVPEREGKMATRHYTFVPIHVY